MGCYECTDILANWMLTNHTAVPLAPLTLTHPLCTPSLTTLSTITHNFLLHPSQLSPSPSLSSLSHRPSQLSPSPSLSSLSHRPSQLFSTVPLISLPPSLTTLSLTVPHNSLLHRPSQLSTVPHNSLCHCPSQVHNSHASVPTKSPWTNGTCY